MHILFFGTYDAASHPRVLVLKEGLEHAGEEVTECNVPLGLGTDWRLRVLRQPLLAPLLLVRLAYSWLRLFVRSRGVRAPDAVVVGYLGHFDVHLARRLFPQARIVLDHMVSLSDTAADRGVEGARARALEYLDRAAVAAADLILVDTADNVALLPTERRHHAVVVAVGAPKGWFRVPTPRSPADLRVVFFGTFTPLQGAPTIGGALALMTDARVEVTMVGRGQDLEATRRRAGAKAAKVRWVEWVTADELPQIVAAHDVCLGIFGAGSKASRVVPNKVYQGAAAGCAIVTSDTPPQREALGDAAIFVPPEDEHALAATLLRLAQDRPLVESLRAAAYRKADEFFRPERIVLPLRERLSVSDVDRTAR